jgi:hypothetical protein
MKALMTFPSFLLAGHLGNDNNGLLWSFRIVNCDANLFLLAVQDFLSIQLIQATDTKNLFPVDNVT